MQVRKFSLEAVIELFRTLDVDFATPVRRAADFGEVAAVFADCKARAKTNFKKLAFENHPDRVPEDYRDRAAERFKPLAAAWEQLQGIEVRAPPPPRPSSTIVIGTRHVRVHVVTSTISTDTTTINVGPW